MSLGDEIFRALTGRRDHSRNNFRTMVQELTDYRTQNGISRRALSRQTGIPETTLRRWDTTGVNEKAQEQRTPQLIHAYRQIIASPGAVARWKADNFSITLHNVPVKGRSRTTADRHLTAAKLGIRNGTGDAVVAAYLAGDDKAAARALAAGVTDPFYGDIVIRGWVANNDDDLAYEGHDIDSDYGVYASAS